MRRILNYSAIYFITLLIYVIIFNHVISDTLVFILFFVTSIFFVFAREALPEPRNIDIPEVFVYQKKRINIYGYIVSAGLIISSIIFAFVSSIKDLRYGIIILILWPILIITSYLASLLYTNIQEKELLLDYVKDNISQKDPRIEIVVQEILRIYSKEPNNFNQILNTLKDNESLKGISIPFLHETLIHFFKYINRSDYSPLSDEIKEINETSK